MILLTWADGTSSPSSCPGISDLPYAANCRSRGDHRQMRGELCHEDHLLTTSWTRVDVTAQGLGQIGRRGHQAHSAGKQLSGNGASLRALEPDKLARQVAAGSGTEIRRLFELRYTTQSSPWNGKFLRWRLLQWGRRKGKDVTDPFPSPLPEGPSAVCQLSNWAYCQEKASAHREVHEWGSFWESRGKGSWG